MTAKVVRMPAAERAGMFDAAEIRRTVENAKKKGLIRGVGDVPTVLPTVGGPSGVTVEWMEVGPNLAKAWLGKNPRNRRLRVTTVSAFASDMRSGNWLETHQGIAIDEDGNLVDGQHRLQAIVESGCTVRLQAIVESGCTVRLQAIVESGCTVRLLVTRGLPVAVKGKRIKTMDAVDRGAQRSLADQLGISHGWQNPNLVAAIAAAIAQICVFPEHQARVTVNQTLGILEDFGEDAKAVVRCVEPTHSKLVRTATVLGPVVFARRLERKKADEFLNLLISGAGLAPKSPILHLRNFLGERLAVRFNGGNNHERMGVQKRVLNALYFWRHEEGVESVKGLAGFEWNEWKARQAERVERVKGLLGRCEKVGILI